MHYVKQTWRLFSPLYSLTDPPTAITWNVNANYHDNVIKLSAVSPVEQAVQTLKLEHALP